MQTENKQYQLGLDIGIASVGWCVLGEDHIIDLGVRAFDKAETDKEGKPLNLVRRQARLMRNRLAHRADRLKKLARLLRNEGLINNSRFFEKTPATVPVWQLRVEGIQRLLAPEEWARVIYHICKHRGFHWANLAEEKAAEADNKTESGQVKTALSASKALMVEKNYQTAAQMLLAEFPQAQRNKGGDYSHSLSRILLADELSFLFECQRNFGNPHASAPLALKILDRKTGLLWLQHPALSGDQLLEMLGKCTFEKNEYRAPKASYTAERHVWLTRLNNLRIIENGSSRPLSSQERALALPLPYQQTSDLSYKQLGAALVKASFLTKDTYRFGGLVYPSDKQKLEEKAKNPEETKLIKVDAWQKLQAAFKSAQLQTEWQSLAGQAQSGNPELLDEIAHVLSVYKEDDEARAHLECLRPQFDKISAKPEAIINTLLGIRFDQFHALSLKALRKIVPFMELGERYDSACQLAGYHHSQKLPPTQGKTRLLPAFYTQRKADGRMVFNEEMDIPRNPVVLRALNQARKVVNALIKKYGAPQNVHIELARDLSRPLDERRTIEKAQQQYRDSNDKAKSAFAEQFNVVGQVKGSDFEKYRLYSEQASKCAYSLEMIHLERLYEPGYVEVDHVLPYSRSFDNGKNNKVLVLAKENQNKGNRTPYEYLGGAQNDTRWVKFVAWVQSNKNYRMAKKNRLLRQDFGKTDAEGFRERNLYDTRYICRFFKNYIENYLQLAETSEAKRCVVVSGQLTALLRAQWGLLKIRADSDRHHALDAAVVAACSHAMVKRMSDHARRKELAQVREGFVDVETGEIVNATMYQKNKEHFPEPWAHFRHELEARLKLDTTDLIRAEVARLGTYSAAELASVKPLFVSRAAQRRNGGAAHKDTIYAQPKHLKEQGGVTQKVPLASLGLKDLDDLIDPQRNEKLYTAIRARLEAHGGKGDKAFSKNNPFYKPDHNGEPNGPLVRGVTRVIDKLSGIPIRGGIAKNDTMLRIDVFSKANRFYLVPVYVHHRVSGLPNRAIVQGAKDESEWTLIDDSFTFCFSIYPNDLIRIQQKNSAPIFGYYRGCHRGTGNINVALHDRFVFGDKTTSLAAYNKDSDKPIANDKRGLIEGIGVKTALTLEKFNVDVLGNVFPARAEPRRGLA